MRVLFFILANMGSAAMVTLSLGGHGVFLASSISLHCGACASSALDRAELGARAEEVSPYESIDSQ